jgi:hypothetical protein
VNATAAQQHFSHFMSRMYVLYGFKRGQNRSLVCRKGGFSFSFSFSFLAVSIPSYTVQYSTVQSSLLMIDSYEISSFTLPCYSIP